MGKLIKFFKVSNKFAADYQVLAVTHETSLSLDKVPENMYTFKLMHLELLLVTENKHDCRTWCTESLHVNSVYINQNNTNCTWPLICNK